MAPPLLMTDPEIQSLAREILARDAYARWRPLRAEGFLEFLRTVLHWFEVLTTSMHDLWVTRPLVYAALVGALLLLATLLLAHIAYALRVALSKHGSPPPPRADAQEPRFLEEAETLASTGRFLEASHCLELAVIDVLLRGHLLELARSDPNRILRHRLREAPLPNPERQDVISLLDRFETKWFRDRSEDRCLYEDWRNLFDRLRRLQVTS